MIAYISFDNSESFENWQKENPEHVVLNITPVVGGFDFDAEGTDTTMTTKGSSKIKVFVTYKK